MFFKACANEGWKIFATGELGKSFEKKNVDYLKVQLKKTVIYEKIRYFIKK